MRILGPILIAIALIGSVSLVANLASAQSIGELEAGRVTDYFWTFDSAASLDGWQTCSGCFFWSDDYPSYPGDLHLQFDIQGRDLLSCRYYGNVNLSLSSPVFVVPDYLPRAEVAVGIVNMSFGNENAFGDNNGSYELRLAYWHDLGFWQEVDLSGPLTNARGGKITVDIDSYAGRYAVLIVDIQKRIECRDGSILVDEVRVSSVPEPSISIMLFLGSTMCFQLKRRRHRAESQMGKATKKI